MTPKIIPDLTNLKLVAVVTSNPNSGAPCEKILNKVKKLSRNHLELEKTRTGFTIPYKVY